MNIVRTTASVALAGLLIFYTWFAFREDGLLKTVPGVPDMVWYYFDHHSSIRNGVGFLVLSVLAAASVTGLSRRWQAISLGLCLAAPLIKDAAQFLFAPTRHFNWDATLLGTLGAALGWGAAALVLRRMGIHHEGTRVGSANVGSWKGAKVGGRKLEVKENPEI
jgi:hypothetical protein